MFPIELTSRKQWLVWSFEQYEGDKKPRKVPYYINGKKRQGTQGSPEDLAHLATYEQAKSALDFGDYSGLGFAFLPNDGLIGIDIDHKEDRDPKLAQNIITGLNTYTELSPSGRGYHLFVLGNTKTFKNNDIGIEVFANSQFFTMTGNQLEGTPNEVNQITEKALNRLREIVKPPRENKPKTSNESPLPTNERAKVESALAYIPADCGYDEWYKIGAAIYSEFGASGFSIWDYWSAKSSKYSPRGMQDKYNSFANIHDIKIATLYGMAIDNGWQPPKDHKQPKAPKTSQPTPKTDEPKPVAQVNFNQDYFRVLGYDRDRYYFYPRLKKQIVEKSEFTDKTFLELAPLVYWEALFPKKDGFDKRAATDWLINAAHAAGIFDPTRIRGRGAWIDNDRIIYHFGDRLLLDNQELDTSEIDSKYFYELNRSLQLKDKKMLTAEEGQTLLEISKMFRWVKQASSVLLLGWAALAPICGALKWRPHLWLTGGAGCGKTTVLNEYVHHLMGGFDIFAQGNSTEAGIRQRLHSDALPVLFDESEQNNEKEQQRVQNILSLIRQASSESGAITYKGTATGEAMNFTIRSMFCLSSIQVGIKHQADIERLTVLALLPKHEDTQAAETWSKLKDELHKLKNDSYIGHRLLMRSLSNIKNILANVNTFVSVAAEKFGSVREGDQCGTLAAGCWSTVNDGQVTREQAKKWLDGFDWTEYRTVDADESIKAFNALLESTIRVKDLGEISVFDIVKAANSYNPNMTRDEADNILQRYGMRVKDGLLYISNNSTSISELVKHTPYASDIRGQLLRIKGSKKEKSPHRFNGIVSKCMSINLAMFDFT